MNDTTPATKDNPLPLAMRRAKRWLLWKSIANGDKKPRKVPHYADGGRRSGKLDTPADAARLVTYAQAVKAMRGGAYTGLGFALGGGWQGLDLDGCRDASTGFIAPWAEEIISQTETYAEISPSETGIHLIGKGDESLRALGSNKSGVEFYNAGRYFTVTGVPIGGKRRADLVTLAPVYDLAAKRWQQFAPVAPADAPSARRPSTTTSPLTWFDAKHQLKKHLPTLDFDDRDQWLEAGMAIHKESDGSEEGYQLWCEWSKLSDKYDETDQWRTWQSFKRSENGVGVGTIIHKARAVKEALRGESQGDAPTGDWMKYAVDTMTRPYQGVPTLPDPDFFVEGLILSKLAGSLVAQGGTGKTGLMMSLGVATALGRPWMGMAVKQGSFVLLSLDDPQDDLDYAMARMVEDMELTAAECAAVYGHLKCVSLRGVDDVIAFAEVLSGGNAVRTEFADDLVKLLSSVPDLRCVALDTLRQFAGGSANDDRVMTLATKSVTSIADRLGCSRTTVGKSIR